jgi:hypothetical protein
VRRERLSHIIKILTQLCLYVNCVGPHTDVINALHIA